MRNVSRRSLPALVVCMLLFACAFALPAPAWASEQADTITIVHTNDIHGNYSVSADDGSTVNYFSVVKGLADDVEADLVVDAGDTFHGNSFATICEGTSIAKLMEAVGYDAMTPGNHDWSYGADQLKALSTYLPVLAANVQTTGEEDYFSDSYVTKEVKLESGDTVKVGVFGVIDKDFYTKTPSYNVEGLSFEDPVSYANAMASYLRNGEGCDLVVALSHNADPQTFAKQTSGIDAVIAGHEHLVIDEVVTSVDDREVPVVEAGFHCAYVGELELTIARSEDDGSYYVSDYEETAHATTSLFELADSEIDALTEKLVDESSKQLDVVIGTSSESYPYPSAPNFETLEGGGWELVRTEDTAIGHLVTASYLAATGADLAFENAGGIRGGIEAGNITVGAVLSVSPYGNTLSTYKLTGAQILETLEHSFEISYQCREVFAHQLEAIAADEDYTQYSWPSNSGSVIVSGGATMEICWDAEEGSRIKSITIGGEPLDLTKTYIVAMNSYLPTSSEYASIFGELTAVQDFGTCEQVIRAYVSQSGWEASVYTLSGTVTYLNADDDEETIPAPEEPSTAEDSGVSQGSEVSGGTSTSNEPIPATGEPFSLAATVGLLGAGALGGGVATRRRGPRPAKRSQSRSRTSSR